MDVVKEAQAGMSYKHVGVLDFLGLGEYLTIERFDELLVKSREFRINNKGLLRLTLHNAFNLRE